MEENNRSSESLHEHSPMAAAQQMMDRLLQVEVLMGFLGGVEVKLLCFTAAD